MEQQNNNYNDEIDFLELIGTFWKYRVLILGTTIFFTLLVSGYLILTHTDQKKSEEPGFHYKAVASLYFPSQEEDSDTKLGLAATRIFKSNKIYEQLIQEQDIFDSPSIQEALENDDDLIRKMEIYDTMFKTRTNEDSEIVDLEFFHPSNEVALASLNKVIDLTLTELESLKTTQTYHIVQEPFISGGEAIKYNKEGSKALLYIILAFILSFMASSFLALVLNFISKVKGDPEALKRLKGSSEI